MAGNLPEKLVHDINLNKKFNVNVMDQFAGVFDIEDVKDYDLCRPSDSINHLLIEGG